MTTVIVNCKLQAMILFEYNKCGYSTATKILQWQQLSQMNKAFTQENDLKVVICFTFWKKKVVPVTGMSYKWNACKVVFYYWTFWGCTWDWVSVVMNNIIVLWGSLWGCAGERVKIHPQNSPKVQYLLQQWPGLKHNLHMANTCCRR